MLPCYHFVTIYVNTCYRCHQFFTTFVTIFTTFVIICYHMLSLLQVLLPFMLSLVTTLFIICYHMSPLLPVVLPLLSVLLPLLLSLLPVLLPFFYHLVFLLVTVAFYFYQKSTKMVDKSVRSFIW